MPPKGKSKYAFLREDSGLRRWNENVARGSRVTADVYLRRLGHFCNMHKTSPKQLVGMNEKKLHNLLMDFVTSNEKQHAGSYIHSTIKSVRSWLIHNRRDVKGKIKIRGVEDTPSLQDERVPTMEELKRILLSGDSKARTASVLVAHSGLRIETLGNYFGDDGLRIRDFPDMAISGETVELKRTPALIVVRKELSKAGHQYFTFLTQEGCAYVKDYLQERARSGEKLSPDTPIVTPKLRMKPFIRSVNISDAIRFAIRKAGLRSRPYVLRSYFDTALMLAESKGLIIRDYRTFFMGHKGDIEARYTTNKNRLPEGVVEDMRSAYSRAQEFLQTSKPEVSSQEQLKEAFRKELMLVAGFKADEIEKIDFTSMSDDDFQVTVRQRLLGAMENNGARQKTVPKADVKSYLAQGWEYVATLDNEVILRLPF